MNAQAEKLIAVPGDDATDTLGSIVFWRLSGDIDHELLAIAWGAAGLPVEWLVEPTTSTVALSRAVADLKTRHRFVRKIAGGWAIIDEEPTDDGLDFDLALQVKLDDTGIPECSPDYHAAAPKISQAWHDHVDRVSSRDIGGWLCRLAVRCDGNALRESGGVYFVPRHGLDEWRKIVNVVTGLSATSVSEVPAMHCDSAVAAVMEAIVAEAQAEADGTLEAISEGGLGPRALATKQRQAIAMSAKVARYEQLLGVSLEEVRDKLNSLDAAVTAATFAALAQGEDE